VHAAVTRHRALLLRPGVIHYLLGIRSGVLLLVRALVELQPKVESLITGSVGSGTPGPIAMLMVEYRRRGAGVRGAGYSRSTPDRIPKQVMDYPPGVVTVARAGYCCMHRSPDINRLLQLFRYTRTLCPACRACAIPRERARREVSAKPRPPGRSELEKRRQAVVGPDKRAPGPRGQTPLAPLEAARAQQSREREQDSRSPE